MIQQINKIKKIIIHTQYNPKQFVNNSKFKKIWHARKNKKQTHSQKPKSK